MRKGVAIVLLVSALLTSPAKAQKAALSPPAGPQSTPAGSAILLTVFLRHDQSRTLTEIESHLRETGFYRDFPPSGTEVISWVVAMGVGQIITLRVPPERLREVNRYIEARAWGVFRTEFYPTYDFRGIAETLKRQQ